MTDSFWPVGDKSVTGCDPVALAALAIMTGCNEAQYENGKTPFVGDVVFWDRVKENREKIAQWVIAGLGISDRARPIGQEEPYEKVTYETIIEKLKNDNSSDGALIREAVIWIRDNEENHPPKIRSARLLKLFKDYQNLLVERGAEDEHWIKAYDDVFGGPLGDLRDLIFMKENIPHPEYYDPDTSHEEDVTAWLKAQKAAIMDDHDKMIRGLLNK